MPAVSRGGLLSQVGRAREYATALWGWRNFAARTAAYCTVSVGSRLFAGEEVPQALMRYFFDGALRQLGVNVVAYGAEKIKPATPCIIAVNHNSMLDIPCVGVLLDFDYKWVSKVEVFRYPFVGWHLRACGHLWVDRQRHDNYERLQREFHRVVSNGASILMFPEGTRSENGALLPFKTGAFVTAVKEGIPVVPIVLDGTERLLEKGGMHFPEGQDQIVRVNVMDPVQVPRSGDDKRRIEAMRDKTRELMVQGLDDLRGSPGAAERPTI